MPGQMLPPCLIDLEYLLPCPIQFSATFRLVKRRPAGKPIAQFQHSNLHGGHAAYSNGFGKGRVHPIALDILLNGSRIIRTTCYAFYFQEGLDSLGNLHSGFLSDKTHFGPVLPGNGKDIAQILAPRTFQGV